MAGSGRVLLVSVSAIAARLAFVTFGRGRDQSWCQRFGIYFGEIDFGQFERLGTERVRGTLDALIHQGSFDGAVLRQAIAVRSRLAAGAGEGAAP